MIMEGVGDEVLWVLSLVVAAVLPIVMILIIRHRQVNNRTIHPDNQQLVEDARQHINRAGLTGDSNSANNLGPRRYNTDEICPICLIDAMFAVETNCGHMFCGNCIVTYWRHGTWLGPVKCPVCRQKVTILLPCYAETEHVQNEEERLEVTRQINSYNRKFSGAPRPLMDYLRDMPTLLRHAWNEFFSVGGLMYMFRMRIVICICAGIFYLVSPLDIIPEAAFGLLGFLDDVFVVVLLAIYISIIYRRFIASRAQNAAT